MRVSFFEEFNSVVSRRLGEADGKMNEAVGMKNHSTMNGGGKRLVCTFNSQDFCKCIGYILLVVTYGKKGHKIWSEIIKYSGKVAPTKLQRDVLGNINLYKV